MRRDVLQYRRGRAAPEAQEDVVGRLLGERREAAAVLHRFCQVLHVHGVGTGQVGDGARDLQHAVHGAR